MVNMTKYIEMVLANFAKTTNETRQNLTSGIGTIQTGWISSYMTNGYAPPPLNHNSTQLDDSVFLAQLASTLGLSNSNSSLTSLYLNAYLGSYTQAAANVIASGGGNGNVGGLGSTVNTFLAQTSISLVGSLGFNVRQVLDTLSYLGSQITVIDNAYRAIYSIYLFTVYMIVANIIISAIDKRIKMNTPLDETSSSSCVWMCTKIYVGIWIVSCFVLFILLVSTLANLYTPFLDDFVTNCLVEEFDDSASVSVLPNGTIFSANLIPIAISLTKLTGNEKFASCASDETLFRNEWCSNQTNLFYQTATGIQNSYQTSFNEFLTTVNDLTDLSNAFELNAINSIFSPVQIHTLTNGFTSFVDAATIINLLNTDCAADSDTSILPVMEFSCGSTFPSCSLTCDLEHQLDVSTRRTVLKTSCMFELYVHESIQLTSCVLMVFIVLNVSRIIGLFATRSCCVRTLGGKLVSVKESRFVYTMPLSASPIKSTKPVPFVMETNETTLKPECETFLKSLDAMGQVDDSERMNSQHALLINELNSAHAANLFLSRHELRKLYKEALRGYKQTAWVWFGLIGMLQILYILIVYVIHTTILPRLSVASSTYP
jgi:hypothetical protein